LNDTLQHLPASFGGSTATAGPRCRPRKLRSRCPHRGDERAEMGRVPDRPTTSAAWRAPACDTGRSSRNRWALSRDGHPADDSECWRGGRDGWHCRQAASGGVWPELAARREDALAVLRHV